MKIRFKDSDFSVEWYSGTGKGGQHRNKHQNCCRVTHIPTGIKANGTENRSRESNKRAAMAVCRSRVVASFTHDKDRYLAGTERVRTYHAEDNRVTDHASGLTLPYNQVVEKNDIEPMIEARLKAKGMTNAK